MAAEKSTGEQQSASALHTPGKNELLAVPPRVTKMETPFDQVEDCTFSTGKLKRFVSDAYSPSPIPFPAQKTTEQVLTEIRLLSTKSGLKKLNAYDTICKLKKMASCGKTTLKLDDLFHLVFSHPALKTASTYSLSLFKPFLQSFFAFFDPQGFKSFSLKYE